MTDTYAVNDPVFAAPNAGRDALRFLRAWAMAPLVTGAQLPSSRQLARAMAAAVDPAIPGLVVELGPGTGVVTAALIARGIAPERLMLVEINYDFCALLAARYPAAQVIAGDAYAIPRVLDALGLDPVAAIVSGLPLIGCPRQKRQRLVRECLRLAAADAPFVQAAFSYGDPIFRDDDAVRSDASAILWRNLWSARVWRYRLRGLDAKRD